MTAGSVPVPAPADRGGIRISDRVLARIAARAATEATEALSGPDGDRVLRPPRASADQGRRGVRVRLGLDLPYPVDIAAVSAEVHRRVVDRIEQLAGAERPRVALVVERLVPPGPPGGLR
jgi:uncharacterized alkaline shock family protein YloU